jgi:small GTP-binding protein
MEVSRNYKSDENNLLSKVVIIGDTNVGKTNIIRRIIGEDFKEMEATIGVEFMYVNIKDIDKEDPNKTMSIQIWDTSGAERYKAITTTHIRGADGAYIVYDISDESSFNHLLYWYNYIKDAADEDIIIYLIGNKSDLIYEEGRSVKKKDAMEFANKYKLHGYAECSAKNNENIQETFKKFYNLIYNKNKNKIKEKTKMKLELMNKKNNEKKNESCC